MKHHFTVGVLFALVISAELGFAQRQAVRVTDLKGNAPPGHGVIYLRTDPITLKQYIGQSWDEATFKQRIEAHNSKLQKDRGNSALHYDFKKISHPLQTELNAAEEAWIRKHHGIEKEDGPLENKRHQVREWDTYRSAKIKESSKDRQNRREQELEKARARGIREERLRDAQRHLEEQRARERQHTLRR